MDIYTRYINLQKDHYARCLDLPGKDTAYFVVIPCFNEPDILTTLNSLLDCNPPKSIVSVLLVVNDAGNSPSEAIAQNILTLESVGNWKIQHPDSFFKVQCIYAHALPQKWAGVGWARKIGMDEAVNQISNNGLADGIIVSLDADSTVSPNYLQTIEQTFKENPKFNFLLINFEHPLDNQELSNPIREGIVRYELHMRYYKNAMKWSGYPHAIHTVGSSFALKGSAYVKQGGMNRRKAGEDFYFLHKLVLLGDYGTINTATVFPACRISDRVPFGTGAALKKWMEGSSELYSTYSLEAFGHLKPIFENIAQFWPMDAIELENSFSTLNSSLQTFCKNSSSVDQLLELMDNCSNSKIFQKRFFHLFNAFWILKYLNFAHETSLKRSDLKTESLILLKELGITANTDNSLENLLELFRELDKQS